ncbi:MAG: hypothetical protein AABY27_04970 [Pseudomonadota bacterium]
MESENIEIINHSIISYSKNYTNSTQKRDIEIEETKLDDDDSIRFTVNYNDYNEAFPKITAVIISNEESWHSNKAVVTVETRTDPDTNTSVFTPFILYLKKIEATYKIKSTEYIDSNGEILTLIHISTKRLHSFALLIQLYKTPETKLLLTKALEKMILYSIQDEFNEAKREVILAKNILIEQQKEIINKISSLQNDKQMLNYPQLFFEGNTQLACSIDLNKLSKLSENELRLLRAELPSSEEIQKIYNGMREVLVKKYVEELGVYVNSTLYNNTINSIPENVEKCKQYLDAVLPDSRTLLNQTFSTIKAYMIEKNNDHYFYNNIKSNVGFGAKITKYVASGFTTFLGIAKNAHQLEILRGNIGPFFEFIDNVTPVELKVISGILTLGSIVTSTIVLYTSDKKPSVTVDDKLIEEFSCRAILCNFELFNSITAKGQDSITKFYGEFLYNAISKNSDRYLKNGSDQLLLDIQDKKYLEEIGLQSQLKTISLDTIDATKLSLFEFIGNHTGNCCIVGDYPIFTN